MERFIIKHQDKITGMISCFDRILFKGYLPICRAECLEAFLNCRGLLFKDFKSLAQDCSQRLKAHAQQIAHQAQRPFIALKPSVRKENVPALTSP